MGKKLIVCCDGTGNRGGKTPDTNVYRVYRALDRAVGALVDASGPDTEVTLLSDHGSGGSSDKVVHLNRLLERHGLLHFRPQRLNPAARLKELALRRLPPRARERLFRLGNAWLPSRLESNVRFGAIDMRRTLVFSDELNYFPGIYLNVAGREPRGIVRPEDEKEAVLRARSALLSTRDQIQGTARRSRDEQAVQPAAIQSATRGTGCREQHDLVTEP